MSGRAGRAWQAAWRWSVARWWGERPGRAGLFLLGLSVPVAGFVLAGPAAASDPSAAADLRRLVGVGAAVAALWVAGGIASGPWREGQIVWWLQKTGRAADFLAARVALDGALVTLAVLLWTAALAVGTAAFGDGVAWDLFRSLPARILLIYLIVCWTALLSAAGVARDSELAALTLILAAVRGVLFPRLPDGVDAALGWILPPLGGVADASAALARADLWTALEAARAPLAFIAVTSVAALWLAGRRTPGT